MGRSLDAAVGWWSSCVCPMARWSRMAEVADLGQWAGAEFWVNDKIIHVYPLFGRKHEVSVECWCCPDVEDGVALHNVDN